MKRTKNHTTLLNKYSLMYEKKPKSRVFAPLAEAYRKLGMLDEAMKTLSQGIKNHPTYTLGYTVLANCYFDVKNYEMAYNTARPFISQNLENITLQKLFANTCINLGHLEEALQTFKYLLLLNPRDSYVAEQIKLLEDDLLVEDEINVPEPQNTDSSFDEDEWVQVSFSKENTEREKPAVDDIENWNVPTSVSPLDAFKNEVKKKSIAVKEHNLNDEFFHEEFDIDNHEVIAVKPTDENPIISHTLVDLYCNQGHLEKAASVLENILELHPDDEATKLRLDELTLKLIGKISDEPETPIDSIKVENSGESTNHKEKVLSKLKLKFEEFHNKLKEKSIQKLEII